MHLNPLAAIVVLFGFCSVLQPAQAETFPTLGDKQTPNYEIENFGAPQGAMPASGDRALHKAALFLIKDFEGWFPDLYNDPAGYCTIGYGHLLAKRNCKDSDRTEFPHALTLNEGIDLLEKDTLGARRDVKRMVTGMVLTDEQFGALTSFIFNVGRENFRKSSLLSTLNDTTLDDSSRITLATKQFRRWVRAGGKIMNGLVARRNCEAALFQGLSVVDQAGNFNRGMCEALGAMAPTADTIDIVTGQ